MKVTSPAESVNPQGQLFISQDSKKSFHRWSVGISFLQEGEGTEPEIQSGWKEILAVERWRKVYLRVFSKELPADPGNVVFSHASGRNNNSGTWIHFLPLFILKISTWKQPARIRLWFLGMSPGTVEVCTGSQEAVIKMLTGI